jgi:cysteine-rich repeat protein
VKYEVSSTCGDGKVDALETCDDHNQNSGDGCSKDCFKETGYFPVANPGPETMCGDGKHEAGEVCDPRYIGYVIDNVERTCKNASGQCVLSTVDGASNCGTGTLEDDEECDDGNTTNGDGCSKDCKIEKTCVIQNGGRAQAYLAVDGDTIRMKVINDGSCSPSKYISIRLHGIDAPECLKTATPSPFDPSYNQANACDASQATNYDDLSKNEPHGYDAQQALSDLIFSEENENGILEIECETRSSDDATCLTDATNARFLAYFKVRKDGKYVDLAEELIRQGYAFAHTYFTSQRMPQYCAAEAEARAAGAGVWALGTSYGEVLSQFGDEKQLQLTVSGHAAVCGD